MKEYKIVHIDDMSSVSIALKTSLFVGGYKNFISFQDTNKAISYINENNDIDLIISDYNMGEMNGVELLKVVKNNDKHKNTPFIILSTAPSIDVMREAKELGLDY